MPASMRAPQRRPPFAVARSRGALLSGRSEFHLRRRKTAHHSQSRARRRRPPLPRSRPAGRSTRIPTVAKMHPQRASSVLRRFAAGTGPLSNPQSQLRRSGNPARTSISAPTIISAWPPIRACSERRRCVRRRASPVGSTGSRLLSGNADVWEELESRSRRNSLAPEAALYFSSGYAANVGLLSFACTAGGHRFLRQRQSRQHHRRHSPFGRAQSHLSASRSQLSRRCAYASTAPRTARKIHRRRKHVQHGWRPRADRRSCRSRRTLWRGTDRRRSPRHRRVRSARPRIWSPRRGATDRVFATVHTCGKALAGMGAFVCGSETLKQFLINRARTFIFSTALPPYLAAQMRAAIVIVRACRRSARSASRRLCRAPARRAARRRIRHLRSDSQIVPVILGANERALDFAARLAEAGFAVRAIRPPTVPAGAARLAAVANTCGIVSR